MRFNKPITLYGINIIDDGIGGREEKLSIIKKDVLANINVLTLEETKQIYGESIVGTIKATILGRLYSDVDRIEYDKKIYKVANQIITKNKNNGKWIKSRSNWIYY